MKVYKSILHVLARTFGRPTIWKTARFLEKEVQLAMEFQVQERVLSRVFSHRQLEVLRGPFAGLLYPWPFAVGSVFMPKVLGAYESELYPTIEALIGRGYSRVINIGAGEGYYAVGLARRIPVARVSAFEASPLGQSFCREMAELNQVSERIEVQGVCTQELLEPLLRTEGGLILCDCEGCELELLRLDRLPNLEYFDLLVELHEHTSVGPTVFQLFTSRFSETHTVETINLRSNKPADSIDLPYLNPIERTLILSEQRSYSVGWMLLSSKKSRNKS